MPVLALAMAYAIVATYALGPVLALPITVDIVIQLAAVAVAWILVKVADTYVRRAEEV